MIDNTIFYLLFSIIYYLFIKSATNIFPHRPTVFTIFLLILGSLRPVFF